MKRLNQDFVDAAGNLKSGIERRQSLLSQLFGLHERRRKPKANRRHRSYAMESLEPRVVLDAHGMFDILFAPGTSDAYREEIEHRAHSSGAFGESLGPGDFAAFQMDDGSRWGGTTSNGGGLIQGDATTITWSIVPDGTSIYGYNGEATSPSVLRSSLDAIYGSISSWLPLFEQSFARLSEVSGVNYVYEPNDDGSAWTSSTIPSGQAGVRGDVRIAGHNIDGNSGVLAYNFFPNFSDMVIDTGDLTGANPFFGNTQSNSIRLRNMLMHEAGHGLGIDHVESNDSSFLMEPYIDVSFEGPQFDDILAMHRGYGDVHELAGNDTALTATDLGVLGNGQTVTVGADSATKAIAATQTDFVSIDDDSDVDFFQFTVSGASTLSLSLDPLGPTYNQGPQNGGQASFVASTQSDLAFSIYDQNGSTVLASVDANSIGQGERINDLTLPAGGTYFVRVSGSQNAAQMYQLQLSTSLVIVTPGVTITQSEGSTNVSEGGSPDSYTVVLDSQPTGEVTILINAGDQFFTDPVISVLFTPSNWNQPKTVSVSAIDDVVNEGDHTGFISHTVVGANYDGVSAASVTVFIVDNDTPNNSPIAQDDSASVLSGSSVDTNVISNDTDSDGVVDGSTVTIISLPSNGTVTNQGNGVVTYTPNGVFTGVDSYSYTVRDDEGAESNVATVSIVVSSAPSSQVLFEDSFEGAAPAWVQDSQGDWFLSTQRSTDGLYSLEVDGRANDATVELANGINISGYSSVLLTYDWLIESGFDGGEYLSLDISGDGGVTWSTDVRQLRGNESQENVWNPGYGAGESTSVDLGAWLGSTDLKIRFRSSVSGSREDANVDNVRIIGVNVGPPNNAPTAVDDNGIGFITDEDSAFVIGDILANDSDPDSGDVISVQELDLSATIGDVIDVGDGNYRYDPSGRFNALGVGESATDQFSYNITDGRGGSNSATVTILVSGVNDAPIANNDFGTGFSTDYQTPLTTANVLSNDTDPDTNDSLVVSSVDANSIQGAVVNRADGTFDYIPAAGFFGSETFFYTVSDGNGGTDTAAVTITVLPPNNSPIAQDDSASVLSGSSVDTNVISNDTDSDGVVDGSTVTITRLPSNGTVTNQGNGVVTYTPNGGFTGVDSYSYTVRDDDGAESNVATVSIVVSSAPSSQVLFEDSFEGAAPAWVQDSQGDWFLSTQRSTDGLYSLEVDGRANDATVELANGINISGYSSVLLTYDWLIESGFDGGEYLSLDISGDGGVTWSTDVRQLRGNESQENVWNPGYGAGESTSVDLGAWLGSTDLKIRFRSSVSGSREDANVDNVRIIGVNASGFVDIQSRDFPPVAGDGDYSWYDDFGDLLGEMLSEGSGSGSRNMSQYWSNLDRMFSRLGGNGLSDAGGMMFSNWFDDHDESEDWLDRMFSDLRLF